MSDIKYQPVPLDEESKQKSRPARFSDVEDVVESGTLNRSLSHWTWLAHAVLLTISMTLFALSLCLSSAHHTGHGFPSVEYKTNSVGLGPAWKSSPYVGHSSEVDEAWRSFTDAGDMFLTDQEAKKHGLSPLHAVKTQHPRTGEWGYRVGLQVFHQLRCLNLLRQTSHGSLDVRGDQGTDIDYCVETLREAVMCHGDAAIFVTNSPEKRVGEEQGERPEFEGSPMCSSFEALRKWSDEHRMR